MSEEQNRIQRFHVLPSYWQNMVITCVLLTLLLISNILFDIQPTMKIMMLCLYAVANIVNIVFIYKLGKKQFWLEIHKDHIQYSDLWLKAEQLKNIKVTSQFISISRNDKSFLYNISVLSQSKQQNMDIKKELSSFCNKHNVVLKVINQ